VLPAPLANPEMLEMFRDPDRRPLRSRVAWAGEFAGKYLTAAAQLHRLAPGRRLGSHIRWFVKELAGLQAQDGYLGPWPRECRLSNQAPNSTFSQSRTWDAWGHYHAMLGLLLWHRQSGDRRALACCRRIGDLLCRRFLGTGEPIAGTGCEEMNQAPVHSLCLLFAATGQQPYLDLARQIAGEFERPGAGDYVREALAGKEFFQTPKPRWESLHPIMGISELYLLTGEDQYRQAFERLWRSMVRTDRHNNGGFGSGELARGDPCHPGAIETCCTVAWSALSVEMLRLSGDPAAADELELSLLNSGLGFTSPSGRWVTYNTPMDGAKIASPCDATAFQARPAGAELNCCSVNGPRLLGMISDWAVMIQAGGLAINYYGPGTVAAPLPSGNRVTVVQDTDYPWEGRVNLAVEPERAERFALFLRIPCWSQRTVVRVNGEAVADVRPGRHLALDRTWSPGDRVSLELDFGLHFWVREEAPAGAGPQRRASIYRGPILLAYDPRFNPDGDAPALRLEGPSGRRVEPEGWLKPGLLMEFAAEDGRAVRLCDFGSAGNAGHAYRSWLLVSFARQPERAFWPGRPPGALRGTP